MVDLRVEVLARSHLHLHEVESLEEGADMVRTKECRGEVEVTRLLKDEEQMKVHWTGVGQQKAD